MSRRRTELGGWILGALLLATLVPVITAAEAEDGPPVRQIKMYAENWRWTPDEIRVPVGTKIVIDFESRDASHSFVMKGYKLKVPLPQDKTKRIEFVADKPGKFRWRCGRPCGDGCAKMTGVLFVE